MVNPKLIELYGESSRPLFAGLIRAIGDTANNYYVVTDTYILVCGVKMPRYIRSGGFSTNKIKSAVHNYIYDATDDEDADIISIFDTEPKEGDIKLCVG